MESRVPGSITIQNEQEAIRILGPVICECRQRASHSRKFAKGESLWKEDLQGIAVVFCAPIGAIVVLLIGQVPLTFGAVRALTLCLMPLLVVAAVAASVSYRKLIRLAIHERGIGFHTNAVLFSEIVRLDNAHPSLNRKLGANASYMSNVTGVSPLGGGHAQKNMREEFDMAYDIVLNQGDPIQLRYLTQLFDRQEIAFTIDTLRASHPDFFTPRELRDLFANFAAQNTDPPILSRDNE